MSVHVISNLTTKLEKKVLSRFTFVLSNKMNCANNAITALFFSSSTGFSLSLLYLFSVDYSLCHPVEMRTRGVIKAAKDF